MDAYILILMLICLLLDAYCLFMMLILYYIQFILYSSYSLYSGGAYIRSFTLTLSFVADESLLCMELFGEHKALFSPALLADHPGCQIVHFLWG